MFLTEKKNPIYTNNFKDPISVYGFSKAGGEELFKKFL